MAIEVVLPRLNSYYFLSYFFNDWSGKNPYLKFYIPKYFFFHRKLTLISLWKLHTEVCIPGLYTIGGGSRAHFNWENF